MADRLQPTDPPHVVDPVIVCVAFVVVSTNMAIQGVGRGGSVSTNGSATCCEPAIGCMAVFVV